MCRKNPAIKSQAYTTTDCDVSLGGMAEQNNVGFESLPEIVARVRSLEISPVELVRTCLERIEQQDKVINSFIAVYADEALQQARVAEQEIRRGDWCGPLHGIPVAVKDLIDIAGKPTTAGSALFLNNVAKDDAGVVKALREAGAIIIGKNNLHEFAYGGSGVISHFGAVRNPKDTARIAGGSSSGSAAAVAAGFCFAAIGTDTAGSIRLPSACCGVVGLKPAYGKVSAQGVVPLSWSYDHVGPIARTVEDLDLVCRALLGWEQDNSTSHALRVGVARKFFFEDVDPEILADVERAIEHLARHEISLHEVKVPVDEDRTVSTAESWEYHKQFLERAELYDPRTLKRIKAGERYTPEEIEQRRQELRQYRAKAPEMFRDVDVIVTPTVPIRPPLFAEVEQSPEKLRALELLMLRNTRPWNVYGVPVITVPCGEWAALQIAGMTEAVVLRAAAILEE